MIGIMMGDLMLGPTGQNIISIFVEMVLIRFGDEVIKLNVWIRWEALRDFHTSEEVLEGDLDFASGRNDFQLIRINSYNLVNSYIIWFVLKWGGWRVINVMSVLGGQSASYM